MTINKEFEKKILEDLDRLGEQIKKSDKVNGKKEALEAYKRVRKRLK